MAKVCILCFAIFLTWEVDMFTLYYSTSHQTENEADGTTHVVTGGTRMSLLTRNQQVFIIKRHTNKFLIMFGQQCSSKYTWLIVKAPPVEVRQHSGILHSPQSLASCRWDIQCLTAQRVNISIVYTIVWICIYIYIMLTMTSLHAARETDFSFNSAAWEQSAPGAKDGAPPPAHTSYMFKRKALDFPRPLESMIKDL